MKIPQLQLLSKTELENSKQLDNYVNSHPSVLTDFAILLGGRYRNAWWLEDGSILRKDLDATYDRVITIRPTIKIDDEMKKDLTQ